MKIHYSSGSIQDHCGLGWRIRRHILPSVSCYTPLQSMQCDGTGTVTHVSPQPPTIVTTYEGSRGSRHSWWLQQLYSSSRSAPHHITAEVECCLYGDECRRGRSIRRVGSTNLPPSLAKLLHFNFNWIVSDLVTSNVIVPTYLLSVIVHRSNWCSFAETG